MPNVIPKIVHQIFFKWEKELEEIDDFVFATENTKKWCKKHDITYRMWDKQEAQDLIETEFSQYLQLWESFKEPIQQVDFFRYIILYQFGGIYLDCDVYPIRSMDKLWKMNYFFTRWANDEKKLPYIAILGSYHGNPLYQDIIDHCLESTYEKQKMEIYQKWAGRLVFQTTGHFMLQRVLKKNKIGDNKKLAIINVWNEKKGINDQPADEEKCIFFDLNTSAWFFD